MEVDARGAAPTLSHPTPGPREVVLPTEMLQVLLLPKQARQARRHPTLAPLALRRPRRGAAGAAALHAGGVSHQEAEDQEAAR